MAFIKMFELVHVVYCWDRFGFSLKSSIHLKVALENPVSYQLVFTVSLDNMCGHLMAYVV